MSRRQLGGQEWKEVKKRMYAEREQRGREWPVARTKRCDFNTWSSQSHYRLRSEEPWGHTWSKRTLTSANGILLSVWTLCIHTPCPTNTLSPSLKHKHSVLTYTLTNIYVHWNSLIKWHCVSDFASAFYPNSDTMPLPFHHLQNVFCNIKRWIFL